MQALVLSTIGVKTRNLSANFITFSFLKSIGRISQLKKFYSTKIEVDSEAKLRAIDNGYPHYDLCIIGAGPAGFAAATRAWDMGKSVCIIEKNRLGGASVWNGALASKTLWQLSRRSRGFREFLQSTSNGLDFNGNFGQASKLTKEAILVKSIQMETQLEALQKGPCVTYFGNSIDKYGGRVTFYGGSAKFVEPNLILVEANGNPLEGLRGQSLISVIGEQYISADRFIIATGSKPRLPPDVKVDGIRVMTSDNIMSIKELPKSICIIGAGVIGCEFAAIFSNFGQTKVLLVNEKRSRLLPTEDADLSSLISRTYKNSGVDIYNNCKVINIEVRTNEVQVTLGRLKNDGSVVPQEPFTVESVLYSIGRIPNTDELNLEKANIKVDEFGSIITDGQTQSISAPHVYAAGDATLDVGLVSVAETEGRYAVEKMYSEKEGDEATPLSYNNVSSIMFLRPEVACIGINEQEALRRGVSYIAASVGFDVMNRGIINRPQYALEYLHSPRSEDLSGPRSRERILNSAVTRLEECGYVKMIVGNTPDYPLLGLRAVGEDASALIEGAALVINNNLSVRAIENVMYPHPSMAEAVQECARMVLGRSVHKPHVFSSCWIRQVTLTDDKTFVEKSIGYIPSYGTEDNDFIQQYGIKKSK